MGTLQQIKLQNFTDCGVLPQVAMDDDYTIDSVIVCDRVSGGKDSVNDMPRTLSLTKLDATGKETKVEYFQNEDDVIEILDNVQAKLKNVHGLEGVVYIFGEIKKAFNNRRK